MDMAVLEIKSLFGAVETLDEMFEFGSMVISSQQYRAIATSTDSFFGDFGLRAQVQNIRSSQKDVQRKFRASFNRKMLGCSEPSRFAADVQNIPTCPARPLACVRKDVK